VKAVIEVRDLSFSYGSAPVLKNINLTVYEQDYLLLLGPNGGGKTTLLKCMLGLLPVKQGSVRYNFPNSRGRIGYVPQFSDFDVFMPMTVAETVRSGLIAHYGLFRSYDREAWKKVDRQLETLDITHLRDEQVRNLSGGQMQRVLIARSLVNEPAILFLDEPTASIDGRSREGLMKLLEKLNRDMPIIMVTHDTSAVASSVKNIACINGELHYHASGEVTEETLEKVYGCPVEMLAHGVPHRVLEHHDHKH